MLMRFPKSLRRAIETAFCLFAASTAFAQIRPLAQEHVALWTSPDPARIYGYTPGICRLPSGRLVVTHEISSAGKVVPPENQPIHESRILTSDDGGKTWAHRANFDLSFARPFVAGKSLYILGRDKQVAIIRSDDDGVTWSERSFLNDIGIWHQSACNVHFSKGNVYLVMEKHAPKRGITGWQVGDLAPVYDMISTFNHIKIMLNHNHAIASVNQRLQYMQKSLYIRTVKTCGWLIKNIKRLASCSSAELGCKLNSLRFSATECCRRLTECNIAQPNFD